MSGIIKKHVHLRFWNIRFFRISFFTGSYRGSKFCEKSTVFFTFSVVFAEILHNFANITQSELTIFSGRMFLLQLEIEERCSIF